MSSCMSATDFFHIFIVSNWWQVFPLILLCVFSIFFFLCVLFFFFSPVLLASSFSMDADVIMNRCFMQNYRQSVQVNGISVYTSGRVKLRLSVSNYKKKKKSFDGFLALFFVFFLFVNVNHITKMWFQVKYGSHRNQTYNKVTEGKKQSYGHLNLR